MATSSSQQEEDPCCICGSAYAEEVICSCSRCGDRQHLWCMRHDRPLMFTMPSTWFCHDCQMQGSSPTQVRDGVPLQGSPTMPSEQSPPHQNMKKKRSKVKYLPPSEAAVHLPSDARNSWLPVQNSIRKRRQYQEKNTPSAALRISSPVKPSAPVRDFCKLTEERRENRERKGMMKNTADTANPFIHQVSSSSPGDGSSDMEVIERERESTDKAKLKELAFIEKFTENPVKTDAIWSGQFEILNAPDHGVYSGLQAFTPCLINRKAYFLSLRLPSSLSFKLISRNLQWDEMFEEGPPDENDVALYMLPETADSCRQPYKQLMDMLDSHDYALHTNIDGAELIFFTSRWLEMTCKESEGRNFLWGAYRFRRCEPIAKVPKVDPQPDLHEEKVEEINTTKTVHTETNAIEVDVVDMKVDMIAGQWIAPEEVICSNDRNPINLAETKKIIKEEKLEFPPGFEPQQQWWKKRET